MSKALVTMHKYLSECSKSSKTIKYVVKIVSQTFFRLSHLGVSFPTRRGQLLFKMNTTVTS